MAALTVRDMHFHNVYYKQALLRWQLFKLSSILALLLAAFMILWPSDSSDSNLIVSVIAFGLLGATVSGLRSTMKFGTEGKIPELSFSMSVLMARVGVGGASALALFLFFKAGLFLSTVETSVNGTGNWVIGALSCAAGFTVRLVLKTVADVAK